MAERVLSRHLIRARAREREHQLEDWQGVVKDWLAEPRSTEAIRQLQRAHRLATAAARDQGRGLVPLVPVRVLIAEKRLIEAGTFHDEAIKTEPRRRRFRWAVVAER